MMSQTNKGGKLQQLLTGRAWVVWGLLLVLTVLLVAAASKFAYLPGDVALTKFVQSLSGENVGWAQTVTNTVRPPSVYVLVALSVALSWWLAGWRAALLALISFGGLWLAEPWLKSLVARPRPSPTLVRVVGSSSGNSFPSGFALIYFSTIGWLTVLAYQHLRGNSRWTWVLLCGVILLIGGCARVALGAHWPSDIYGAYLIGLVWTMLLAHLVFPKRIET